MKIAILDDEQTDRDTLSAMIQEPFSKTGYAPTEIEKFESGEDFLSRFTANTYDIVFLDIYMKKLTGIETAQRIRALDRDVKLVFVSTSNDFASESYAVHADDYILKPFGADKLIQTVSRLRLSAEENRRIFTLPDGQAMKLSSILYSSFAGHYVSIYLKNGTCIKTRLTQSAFQQLLFVNPGFLSCNPGMTVNLREVETLEADRFIMSNGSHIPISRRRYSDVKAAYSDFLILQMRKGADR